MKRVRILSSVMALVIAATSFAQSYQANYTSSAPTIDGVISPGEWDGAEAGPVIANSYGSAFQLMWDDDALYGLITTNYGPEGDIGFVEPFPGAEDSYQWDLDVNWNFYVDPNRDGEDLDATPNNAVDGYQIAVHTYDGTYNCGPCSDPSQDGTAGSIAGGNPGTSIGTFAEGHIDSLWGNQAQWAGLRDTTIAMINDNATGGVSEIRIPWTDLDASGGDTGDTGLDLMDTAPVNGEEWSWNTAYVFPGESNFTPIWVGGTPFAEGPHGRVTFEGAPTSGGGGDFDGNGAYECADIDALTGVIASGSNDLTYDLTGDGAVNVDDQTAWLAEAATANGLGSPYKQGDANLDGTVDVSDFNKWNENKFTDAAQWCNGDFTADGVVDVSDFNAWNGNKFTSSDGGTNVVPEPSALALVMVAGLSLLGLRRRRN